MLEVKSDVKKYFGCQSGFWADPLLKKMSPGLVRLSAYCVQILPSSIADQPGCPRRRHGYRRGGSADGLDGPWWAQV